VTALAAPTPAARMKLSTTRLRSGWPRSSRHRLSMLATSSWNVRLSSRLAISGCAQTAQCLLSRVEQTPRRNNKHPVFEAAAAGTRGRGPPGTCPRLVWTRRALYTSRAFCHIGPDCRASGYTGRAENVVLGPWPASFSLTGPNKD
jgi:hypothetical protein